MRLYLAVAVLLLALIAYTEAQDQTFEEKVTRFGEKVAEGAKDLSRRAEAAFQSIHESETAEQFRQFFSGLGERMRNTFTPPSN